MTKVISFSVSSPEHKAYIEEFAKARGFRNGSALALFALYRYLNTFSQFDPCGVLHEALEGKIQTTLKGYLREL